jgi:hypothetical protein
MSECSDILAAINALAAQAGSLQSQIAALNSRLDRIERKIPTEDGIANKVINGIRALLENLRTSLSQEISAGRIQVITRLGALETAILANLRTIETGIKELGYTLRASMDNLRQIILAAINALRDILVQLIRGLFGIKDPASIDYDRIASDINAAHKLTRTLILEKLGRMEQYLAKLQIKVDYERIDTIVKAAHAQTRLYIARLFEAFKPKIDLNPVLQRINSLETAINNRFSVIIAILNYIVSLIKNLGFSNNQNQSQNIDYDRISAMVNSAHRLTRTLILEKIGNTEKYLGGKIDSISSLVGDYGRQIMGGISQILTQLANLPRGGGGSITTVTTTSPEIKQSFNRIDNTLAQVLGELRKQIAGIIVGRRCDGTAQSFNYSGSGMVGLQAQINSLANAQALLHADICTIPSPSNGNQDLIQKIATAIGVDDYPVTVPETFITQAGSTPKTQQLTSLSQFFYWYVKRFDELMGQWEVAIEVKDTDPNTPGDQPKGFKLPNVAELLAESFSLGFQAYTNTEIILNIVTRNLVETGTDKQQNFITYKLLQSLTDWVGFKQRDIKLEMPLTFTPNKTRYDEILKESTVKVNCVEFDDKFGLEADLMRFREAAGILQALYKRRLNPNGDIEGQILDYLLKTFRGMNKVNDGGESFQEFINRAENGFTDIPTVGDPTQPYGRPYDQRPRIKDLSDLDGAT